MDADFSAIHAASSENSALVMSLLPLFPRRTPARIQDENAKVDHTAPREGPAQFACKPSFVI
jgi:hypothetical protein